MFTRRPPALDPRDVTAVRWRGRWNMWVVTAETSDGPVRFVPALLDPADALPLVRGLRAQVPRDRQIGWTGEYSLMKAVPGFAREAVRLVRCDLPTRPLRAWERFVWRTPSAGVVAALTLAGVAFGVARGCLSGEWVWLAAGPVLLAGSLLVRRLSRGWGGPRVVTVSPLERHVVRWLLGFIAVVVLVSVPLALLMRRAGDAGVYATLGVMGTLLVGFLVFYTVGMIRQLPAWQAFERDRDAEAAAEWDRLHAPRAA